jgi:hypothetical protein
MTNYFQIALIVALSTMALPVSAGTYYVSTEGSAENDGSREKPWPIVDRALSKVGGGKTNIVRPGTYRGPIQIAKQPESGGNGLVRQRELQSRAGPVPARDRTHRLQEESDVALRRPGTLGTVDHGRILDT